MMEDIIKHMDDSALKELSQLDVKLRCSNKKNKKKQYEQVKRYGEEYEVTSYLKVHTDVTLEWYDFLSLQI